MSEHDEGAAARRKLSEVLFPAFHWEARFDGGNGGAAFFLADTLIGQASGRSAIDLADALDPGRSSRPMGAAVVRAIRDLEELRTRLRFELRGDDHPLDAEALDQELERIVRRLAEVKP